MFKSIKFTTNGKQKYFAKKYRGVQQGGWSLAMFNRGGEGELVGVIINLM